MSKKMEKLPWGTFPSVNRDPDFHVSQLDIGRPSQNKSSYRGPTNINQLTQSAAVKNIKDEFSKLNNLGGICFDFEASTWSSASVVEETGQIHLRGSNIRSIAAHGVDMEEGLELAGRMALAAGKIYFKNCVVDAMSGFYLEGRYFITAAHFKLTHNSAMKVTSELSVRISSARYSKYPEDITVRTAHLLHHDEAADIAIFVLDKDQEDAPATLRLNDLFAVGDVDYRDIKNRVIFASGYNGEDQNGQYPIYGRAYFDSTPLTKQGLLRQLLWTNPPNFEGLFKPNERSICIGRLVETLPTNPGVWHHSVSGWNSMAGGMIGTMEKIEVTERTSLFKEEGLAGKIIGIFKGGKYDEEGNDMVVFTKDILETLMKLIYREPLSSK